MIVWHMTDQPKRRGRKPGVTPVKVHITMRVDRYVYDHFDGDLIAMREVLREHVDRSLTG